VGIYSKIVAKDTPLRDGDRIELYRPLAIDPKEKRRLLARKNKK
jgi:putative ubiquitin-RnfH superfamily antitoxin RatB of RatAB toxin-antitoxin module